MFAGFSYQSTFKSSLSVEFCQEAVKMRIHGVRAGIYDFFREISANWHGDEIPLSESI